METSMEKKESPPVMGLIAAMVFVVGFVGCGIVCFTLDRALKIQRHDLGETRAQIIALNQALEVQRHDLKDAREELATVNQQVIDAQKANQTLNRQLTELQSKMSDSKPLTKGPVGPMQAIPVPAAALDVPAVDSVEGKLSAEGKHWERMDGQPITGGYVQDILEGRLDQPKGRGRLGMVLSMADNGAGRPVATVDFGHGYVIGIAASELAPVRLLASELR
jgi:hypothetical protein